MRVKFIFNSVTATRLLLLGYSDEERRFVELLHERDRSFVKKRRAGLARRIERIRERHRETEKHISAKRVEASAPATFAYYLDPRLQVLHMFATLGFQLPKVIDAAASSLGLSSVEVEALFRRLEEMAW